MARRSQRRMASELMGVGENAVWVDPQNAEKVSSAITREDIRGLIRKGLIGKRPKIGTSRLRARKTGEKKRKGHLRGPGSRKGSSSAGSKREWIKRVRSLRRYIQALRQKGLDNKSYRDLYKKVAGGYFRNKSHLKIYLEKEGMGVK